jgi:hypothetical protein
MGEILDLDLFRSTRKSARRFQSITCVLCDVEVEGNERDDEVHYVCMGDVAAPHNRVEWSHTREHVAMGS